MPRIHFDPRFFALVLCLTLFAVPAFAGPQIFAGVTAPMGDLNDAGANMGYHGGVSLGYPVVPLTLSVGPAIIYHKLPGQGDDDSFTFLELMAMGSLTVPAGPTVFGGLGYAFPGAEVGGVDLDPDTELAVVIGTGTKVALLEIKGMWHHLGDADFISISAGLGF